MPEQTGSKSRSFWSPLFVVSAAALVAAAVGFRPALAALMRYYTKEPIALRRSLDEFDGSGLRSFRPAPPVSGYEMAEGDVETEDVLDRVFELRASSGLDRTHPYAALFVTYYSDPRDTIPHTPEVCYRQGGAVVWSIETVSLEVPGIGGETAEIDAKVLEIEQEGRQIALVYVFCSNGRFYHDRERVRMAIALPGDKYTYFSKIEAVTLCPPETTFAVGVERCKRLLSEALPVLLEEHYPRGEDLKR